METYYAVQVVTGQEEKIKELLLKRYGRQRAFQGVKIIIPRHLVRCKVKNRYKNVWKPIWPGYLVLSCVDLSAELYHMLRQLKGVIRILTTPISTEEWQGQAQRCGLLTRLELVRRLLQRKRRSCFRNLGIKLRSYLVIGLGYRKKRAGLYRKRLMVLLN